MTVRRPHPSQREILAFWLPMAGTWLMMAAEAPFLAALIARLAEPKYNLAAFGVAYAIAILVEAPVIMILSASTALVEGPVSLRRLRRLPGHPLRAQQIFQPDLTLTPSVRYAARRPSAAACGRTKRPF